MRLTNDIKLQIRGKAVSETFDKEQEELKIEEHKLAEECYYSVFDKELIKKISKIPEEWLRQCDCLMFTATTGYRFRLNAAKKFITPANNGCSTLGVLSAELTEKVIALDNKKNEYSKRRWDITDKITVLLSGIKTVKQLKQLWPEGEVFYKDFIVENKNTLPAIQTSEINKILGIA